MTGSHEELREALGTYALDQLDDDLRQAVRDHLTSCASCRGELAEIDPLADELRAVDPDAILLAGGAPPKELDERIRRAIPAPQRRSRGWIPAVGLALAAAAAAVAVTMIAVHEDKPTIVAVPDVTVVDGVTATAGLVDHSWGVEIKLEATGLADGERFEVWVIGQDGRAHEAGAFLGVEGTKIVCDMSSAVLLDDAASFRIVDDSGTEVIAAAMPSS